MGVRGERVVEALLAAREEGRMVSPGWHRTRVPLDEYVAKRLKDLGLIHDFRVDKIADRLYQVHVQKAPGGPKVELPDVGFGVSQVLPAMVLCYYVPEGSTVILEQPEIHLHPSVQAGLADVFIEAALTRHVQVIFESHSEYLLKRLQRRMAEGKLKPTDAALYFCQLIDGTSTLTPLELGLYGQIANWPKDFFGDEFSEVVEASLAAIKRREGQGA
jgi:predicted ATPase